MRPLVILLAAVLCMAAGAGHAAEPAAPLVVERTIALKGVSGRIDHLAIDLGRKRLFVAELGNGTVDVIDLASASVIRRIEGLKSHRASPMRLPASPFKSQVPRRTASENPNSRQGFEPVLQGRITMEHHTGACRNFSMDLDLTLAGQTRNYFFAVPGSAMRA